MLIELFQWQKDTIEDVEKKILCVRLQRKIFSQVISEES